MDDLKKIAVLIDADNTQLSKIDDVLQEISTRGRIILKRAYGNWRKDSLKNWESEIKRLAIKPEQQFDYVTGKNATDMALVIDTIELLYSGNYDAFAIVSSDSDYTPLAIKLREAGVYVMGVGEKKTPVSFRNSCDDFLFLENLSAAAEEKNEDSAKKCEETKKAEGGGDSIDEIHVLLRRAFNAYQDEAGYVKVSRAGDLLKRAKPDFDCRTYGFKKLTQLLAAFPQKYRLKTKKYQGTTTIVAYQCIS